MYKHNSWFIITAVIGRRQKKIKNRCWRKVVCAKYSSQVHKLRRLCSQQNLFRQKSTALNKQTSSPVPLRTDGRFTSCEGTGGSVFFPGRWACGSLVKKTYLLITHREREKERLQTHGTARNLQPQTEEPRRQSLVDTNTEVQVKESLAATSWRLAHRTTSISKETVGNIRWWGNLPFAEMMVNTVLDKIQENITNKQKRKPWKYYYNN